MPQEPHNRASAADPLPPVEQVRPGLWSIPVPIPDNPLRYVLVYAFETPRGPYIVDAGWNTEDAWQTLVAGLATAGMSIGDVQGVLVTHIHPDHYGLAPRVREASGAWVSLHPADAQLLEPRYEDPADLVEAVTAMLRREGAPPDEVEALGRASLAMIARVAPGRPDILMEDGDKPEVPGWDLRALWTPGHSPGHLCFFEPANRLLLSGDHVLPRITPNVAYHPQAGRDPLGAFLGSFARLEGLGAEEVLPAHEHRFRDLDGRLAELRAHHEARFAEAIAAIAGGEHTAWGIAGHFTWNKPWDQIRGFMRRMAVGEVLAHLHNLAARGVVREVIGEPSRWELTERA